MLAARHLGLSPVSLPLSGSPIVAGPWERSVLYIDDDWQSLTEWCRALEAAGYFITATDSPAAAVGAVLHEEFDAIVVNFHLPFVSSGLLAQVLHKFRHDVPLLLISDCSEEQELSPWDRRVSEGVAPAQLVANLQAVIEHGRRARIAAAIVSALPCVTQQ